jgi:hypothetical protein
VTIGTRVACHVVEDEVRRRRCPGPIRLNTAGGSAAQRAKSGATEGASRCAANSSISATLWPSRTWPLDDIGSRGCWRSHEYNFFPLTPLAQRTRPVSSSVASVRQFGRVQAALEREAVAAMPGRPGCLAVWLSCTSGTSGTSGVSERERKPLDLILWLPFRGLSAHRDSRLAPCKNPHPVLFGPVLFCPVLPCTCCPVLPRPWTMQ